MFSTRVYHFYRLFLVYPSTRMMILLGFASSTTPMNSMRAFILGLIPSPLTLVLWHQTGCKARGSRFEWAPLSANVDSCFSSLDLGSLLVGALGKNLAMNKLAS